MNIEQKKIDELLAKISEMEKQLEFYQLIANDSPDWEVFRSKTGKVKYVNKAFERITGYSRQDFLEGKITEKDFVHPDDLRKVQSQIEKALQQNPLVDIEFRIIRPDGNIKYLNKNSIPILINGEFLGVRTSIRDISEQRSFKELQKFNQKLKESEDKFKKYITSSPTSVFITDKNARFTFVNPAGCNLLGYSRQEMLELSIPDISPESTVHNNQETFLELLKIREISNVEAQLSRKDKKPIDVFLDAVKISDNEYISFVKDMTKLKSTERKLIDQIEEFTILSETFILTNEELKTTNIELFKAKEEAEENERYFKTLIEKAPFPMVISDINQDIEIFNDKFTEVFGYTKDDISTSQQWWDAAYPDLEYRETVKNSWLKAIEDATKNNTDIAKQEWEIQIKNGSKRLCEFFMTPLGKLNLIVMNDITEERRNLIELIKAKKNAEKSELELQIQNEEYASLNEEYLSTNEELRSVNESLSIAKELAEESEEKHRFLFENMTQGVVYHQNNGEIVYANDSAAKILAMTKDQLIGKTSLDPRWKSIHEDGSDYPGNTHPVMITLNTGKPVRNAIMGVTNLNTGEYIWININSLPKFDKHDKEKISQVIVTFEDITDLKNAIKHIEINEKRYRKSQQVGHIGSWEYDLEKNLFWASDEGKMIYGFDVKSDYFNVKEVMQCVIEKEKVDKAMTELIQIGKPYNIEFDIIPNNSKEKRTIHSVGELELDKNGNPLKVTGVLRDITEQKNAQFEILKAKKRTEESEQRFKALHNASFGGIAIHDKGIILDCNQGLSQMTGFTFDELIGMDGLLLIAESKRDMVMNNIVNKFEKPYEAIGVRKNGEEYPIRLEAREIPYHGKMVRVVEFRDITKQKNAEMQILKAKELAENNEKQFRQLFENMEQGFALHEMLYDDNGVPVDYRFILINKAFVELTRIDAHQFIGKTVKEVLPLTEQVWIDNYGNVAKTGTPMHFSNYSKELDKHYEVVAYSPKKDFFAVVITDVTQKKKFEFELVEAKNKAEESNQLKSSFLQNMSHEIRTPMNAIIGFSQFLSEDDLSDENKKSYTTIIQNSCKQLLSIVNDILTISSIDTNQEKVRIQVVNINSLIVEMLSIFKKQATNKNISLYAIQPLQDNQSEIMTDKTKVTQILTNLINNALKFTYEGFVEFGYNLIEQSGVYYLQFYVKDTGIGIKPELHEQIFERFRQADETISLKHGGTGLGLSICKGFVDLLGGEIYVQSEHGIGSTFYFTIPYNAANMSALPTIDEKNDIKQHKVLVAEDEEYNYLFIEITLKEMNIDVIHAKNGQESVDICKSNPDIDLILMDIKMPVMDGHQAAKLIKEFRPALPIIAQSAYALEREVTKYEDVFDSYLTKPINKEELKKSLAEVLKINESGKK